MSNKANELNEMISSLAIFRSVREDSAVGSLLAFLESCGTIVNGDACGPGAPDETAFRLSMLSDFAYGVLESGTLRDHIFGIIKNDENPFLMDAVKKAKSGDNAAAKLSGKAEAKAGTPRSNSLYDAAEAELDILEVVSEFSPDDAKALMEYKGYVPFWETGETGIKDRYLAMIREIPEKGYGAFADYYAFRIKDGELTPVKNADPQTLDSLYGYEREREKVYENTRALAEGDHAANVLLYGDAGTGKSSTIKACANAFKDKGVRLIEFDKDQISDIPAIIDKVFDTPLKYIFYIDDLSFSSEDDDFCYLKGILEGNITGKSDNIVIYATSNRRHLVRELAEDRTGSDIHINDTLQQTMSLSARFGITVTFSKPGKDLYLEIVRKLAEEDKLTEELGISIEELELKAERFAVRSNGRSPRTAKQFLQLLRIGQDI